jgi:hypothetical protein
MMKNQGLASALGLPNKQDLLLQKGTADDVPAEVTTLSGEKGQPVQVSEGEYVFSMPAIIGLGQGNYEEGLALLEQIHSAMYEKGVSLLDQQGIGGI